MNNLLLNINWSAISIQDVAYLLVSLAAVSVTLKTLNQNVITPIKIWYKKPFDTTSEIDAIHSTQITSLTDSLTDVKTRVEYIYNALQRNGGESIKDLLDRLESNQRYLMAHQKFSENLADKGTIHFNSELNCIYINRYAEQLLQTTSNDVLGFRWLERLEDNSERRRIQEEWKLSCEQGIQYWTSTRWRVDRKKYVNIELLALPYFYNSKNGQRVEFYFATVSMKREVMDKMSIKEDR